MVSLEALRSFLINFMKTLPGGEGLAQEETRKQEERLSRHRPKEPSRPTNTHNARAVRAYQSMASHAEEKGDSTEESDISTRQVQHAGLLESKELRDIYGLIDDLELLRRRGIEQVHIKKADSFIEALKNAVTLLKSKA